MAKKAPALHELLAVETGLGTTANRIQKETTKTLNEKKDIFKGMSKIHTIFAEEDQHKVQVPEHKEIQSTVKEQLDFMGENLANYWNVILQKDETNQRAKADIIVDGKILAANIPSTTLLSMEKKIDALLSVYNAIPTLDAATAWEDAPEQAKKGVYRTKHAEERMQSVTEKEWKEISPATIQHQAQLKEVEKTTVVGKYTITNFSAAITSYDKAEKLKRLTTLLRAVQKARQRANATEVNTELKFAEALFGYING